MAGRFELGETGVQIVFQRLAQKDSICSRLIGSKHPIGKPTKPDRVVVRPRNRKAKSLREFLEIDQGRPGVNPYRLSTIKQFSRMTGRARNSQDYILLSRVRINESVIARKTHRETIGILQRNFVRNKTKTLQIGVFPE